MGRNCSQCGDWESRANYSNNQWMKGDGASRCRNCVNGNDNQTSYVCHECGRNLNSQNQLDMHKQTHRPRDWSCPKCGDTRFRSGANAVQHVESGFCTGCLGKDNARQTIYKFASKQSKMTSYMTARPQLTNGDWNPSHEVPEYYHCPGCVKTFRHLSQLLQHQDQKHGHAQLLAY
jgi:DNA-directed RNA polymerase subunit RPC12/RpoP